MPGHNTSLTAPRSGNEVLTLWRGKAELFCLAMMRGLTQTSAAIEAGYSERGASVAGSRMVRHPAVQARIAKLRENLGLEKAKALARVEMPRRENILRDLVMTRDMATEQNNLAARLKANELLGKELGMFVTRVDASITSPLDGLSREQLLGALALFSGGAKVIEGNVVEVPVLDVSRETLMRTTALVQPLVETSSDFEEDDPLA